MADNNVTEIEGLKEQIIKSNKLALDEIDIKVENASQKLEGMITIGLTNMLDQQHYLANGIRVDAKKIALEKLSEAMDQAVQETLQRLGVGIDQIVKISLQNRFGFHLEKLKEMLKIEEDHAKMEEETEALEIIDMSEINRDDFQTEINHCRIDFQPEIHCQILPDYQSNQPIKIISFPQELALSDVS